MPCMKRKTLKLIAWGAVATVFVVFALFAPSFDRQEEMHGYLRSGKYVIGNGIMVGIDTNRIAFLTCRHVVTEKMLETGLSFIDKATADNAICINRKGRGFVYATIANIDPARWHFAPDADHDFAWIVLTDDELRKIAPDGCPPFIMLPADSHSQTPELITEWYFPDMNIDVGSRVSVLRLFSPVLGQGSAENLSYLNLFLQIPFRGESIALTTRCDATLRSRRINQRVVSNDPINRFDQVMPLFVTDMPGHVNVSGSPVFAEQKDGKRPLIGLINSSTGNASGFQSLDCIIAPIRRSLSVRVIDGARPKADKALSAAGVITLPKVPKSVFADCESDVHQKISMPSAMRGVAF